MISDIADLLIQDRQQQGVVARGENVPTSALELRAHVDRVCLHGVLLNLPKTLVPKEVVERLATGAPHLVPLDQLRLKNRLLSLMMTRRHRGG